MKETIEQTLEERDAKQDAMLEALEACEQCITDFLQVVDYGNFGLVLKEPIKSLKNDALRLAKRALANETTRSERAEWHEKQMRHQRDLTHAAFCKSDEADERENLMFMELARTSVELTELRRATMWIPVAEKSPEVAQYVLFRFADGSVHIGARYSNLDEWNFRREPENYVVAWMSIPEYEVPDAA